MPVENEYGQPIGDPIPGWTPARRAEPVTLSGRWCTLEPLDAGRHASDLYAAFAAAPDDSDWTYIPLGPFTGAEEFREWAIEATSSDDLQLFAIVDNDTGRAVGTLALLRQDLAHGSVEVGYVLFSRALKRTPVATEAQFLLMRYVFDDLGFRRYEWKCDSLNAPSRRAAQRLGFAFEGTFRQAWVYKGRNRDTDWFSLLDGEWPLRRAAFESWLSPTNFDDDGHQRTSLAPR